MGWNVYRPTTDFLVKKYGERVSKKERGRRGFADEAMREILVGMGGCSLLSSYDVEALHSEMDWKDKGCLTYFPESVELLRMLWRAKMSVSADDIGMGNGARVFSVAWPTGEVGGFELPGCMVWWGSQRDRLALIGRWDRRILGRGHTVVENLQSEMIDEVGLLVCCMCKDKNNPLQPMGESIYRFNVGAKEMGEWLSSEDKFSSHVRVDEPSMMVFGLDGEESRRMYAVCRMVVRMLVYMRACPGKVTEGYPSGRHAREFETRWTELEPHVIGQPAGMRGEHGSPCAHWRTWHFRSYPRKADGTKKSGVVFIDGTVVGAEVEPVTVKE